MLVDRFEEDDDDGDDAGEDVRSSAAASAGADGEVVEVAANVPLPPGDGEEDDTAGWEGAVRWVAAAAAADAVVLMVVVVVVLEEEELCDDNDDDDNDDDGDDGDEGDVVDITAFTDVNILFQLIFTRLRGGPIGGICCVASARYASFSRCGWVATMFFQPTVSTTSVA